MRFALVLVCVLTSLAGCRKKTAPEFFKLESQQSVLIAREGDDAYVSAEMDSIIGGLEAIPGDAREKPRAVDLVQRLSAEKARVAAERVPRPPPPPPADPFAGREPAPVAVDPAEPAPAGEDVPDAGPSEPFTGMDEATFKRFFGTCFSPGPKTEIAKGTPATTQVLASNPDCQKRFGTPGGTTTYVFVDGGVAGKMVETYVVVDAGFREVTRPAAPPPPPPDAGPPILTIPGAPLPEGYEKSTPY